MFRDSDATITCWAMGITQHHNSVAVIKEIVNVAMLQGNIGRPGAGLCPVRGHSNVQGDRTMGVWEQVPDHFLDALRDEFGFEPPREHGYDTVKAIRAMRDGKVRVFMGMGGNFVSAAPDTEVTETGDAQLRAHRARVHQAEPVPRRHRRGGADPAGARSQRARPHRWPAPARHGGGLDVGGACLARSAAARLRTLLKSEVDIVCSLALATLPDSPVPWAAMRDDYTQIRRHIARVVPGCASYDEKVDQPGGFVLPHPPRDSRDLPDEVRQGGDHVHARSRCSTSSRGG